MLRSVLGIPAVLIGTTILYLFLTGGHVRRVTEHATSGFDKVAPRDKTIVVASTKESNTTWVHDELPDWNPVIYVVDDPTAPYHTAVNKGNEANVYLTYILDHYDSLPSLVVFTHHHRIAGHLDMAFATNPDSIQRLNLSYVQEAGYQSLTCVQKHDCNVELGSFDNRMDEHLRDVWPRFFPDIPTPEILTMPANAQFAVTRAAILARSKADYQCYFDWLMETDMPSFFSGRMLEYTWHVIFGKPPYICQLRRTCLCQAFDICDLDKHQALTGTEEARHKYAAEHSISGQARKQVEQGDSTLEDSVFEQACRQMEDAM